MSHLKELTIKGTEENKLMNTFREQISMASPPEIKKLAEQFIKENSESNVSVYLLRRYFIANQEPDFVKANELINILVARQSKNGVLKKMQTQVKSMLETSKGKLPLFSSIDVKGNRINNSTLNGKTAVILTWASWSYESMDFQRRLQNYQRQHSGNPRVVSICIDPTRKQCMERMRTDSITFPVVCDEQMLEGTLLKQFGLYNIPGNLLIENGRITARNLNIQDLIQRLNKNS